MNINNPIRNSHQPMKLLPRQWNLVKLGEVCEIQTGKYDANHAKAAGKYRFYTCAFEFMYCDTNRFKGASLILPGNGANVGEVFYYNGEFDAYQRTYVLNEIKCNPKYLYYHLLCNWRKRNQDKQFGSATNYIRMGNFTDYELPIPPKVDQEAIVFKIEELFSELDKGIENLRLAQQQLKTYRQSVLKWAFEGKLTNENVKEGELPKGWKMCKLGEVIKISTQKHSPVKQEILFYIGLEHIEKHSGKLTLKTGLELIKTVKNKFSKGDILYGKLRPNLNKVYLANQEGVCSTDILVLKLEKNCSAKYLHNIMRSTVFVNTMSENTSGVNLPRVPTKFILEYTIPLPPIKEQEAIIQDIESRFSVADKMEESITQSLKQAEALRQSILKKAFEAKFVF